MKKYLPTKLALITLSAFLLPFVSSAASCDNTFDDIGKLFTWGTCIIGSSIIPLLISVALVVFIIGVVKFIANADNEEKRTEGRQFIIWGIVGLFVIVSVWGLVAVLQNTFFDGGLVVPQL